MLVRTLVLLIAIGSLIEIRRNERRIVTRFIERGRQRLLDTNETAKEDEKSLINALHSSKIALWIITILTGIEFVHSLFMHE